MLQKSVNFTFNERNFIMYCENCGKKLMANEKVCKHCGAEITQEFNTDSNKSGKKKAIFFVVGFVIIIIIMAVIIISLLTKPSDENNSEDYSYSSEQSQNVESNISSSEVSETSSSSFISSSTVSEQSSSTSAPVVEEPEIKTVPTNLKADTCGKAHQLEISWSAVENATEYRVELYDGDTLLRAEMVTEPKCLITDLEYGKDYGYAVQAFVNSEWSELSEKITATTLTRKQQVENIVSDYNQGKINLKTTRPYLEKDVVLGTGDLICTVEQYELHVKTETSFSGDTTYFGVYNTELKEWTLPYSDKYNIFKLGVSAVKSMQKQSSGLKYINNNTLIFECRNELYTYDFLTDKLTNFGYETCRGTLSYIENEILMLCSGYDYSYLKAYDWNGNYIKTINKWPVDNYNKYEYASIKEFYDDYMVVKFKPNNAGILAIINYNGDIILKLTQYESRIYNWSTDRISYNHNNGKILTAVEGEDSGVYACLFNSDESLACEPIKLFQDEPENNDFKLLLFDDFFVIGRTSEDDTEKSEHIDELKGVYIYELDGTLISHNPLMKLK